jgi:hypothetical protein
MKKVTAIVPNSLADITLGQYQKYDKLLQQNKDAEEDRFVHLKMLQIFCGLSYDDANNIRLVDFEKIITKLYDVLLEKPKLVTTFTIGDTEFGFIPDLENMTFGEFIDLENFISDIQDLEKAMAVLYRPIKQKRNGKYLIKKYEGDLYHEAMKYTPMDAVTGSMLFFWSLGIDCLTAILNYSENEEKTKELLQKRKVLEKNGDGSLQSTNSLKMILQDLTILRNLE